MRPLDDRYTGYATENVEPITALDREAIDELWVELRLRLPQRPVVELPEDECE